MAEDFEVTSVVLTQRQAGAAGLMQYAELHFELTDERGSGEISVPAVGNWQPAAVAKVQAEVEKMLALLSLPGVSSVNVTRRIGSGNVLERMVHVEYEVNDGAGLGSVDLSAGEDWERETAEAVQAEIGAVTSLLEL